MPLPDAVREIAGRLIAAGYDTWCVGGAVRDWRMGIKDNDVDLATAATPEQVQALFRRTVAVGVKYGTVGVLDPSGGLHEVTTFRKDVSTDGRHAVVEYGVSIDDDLDRRDFTINALAYHPVRHEIRDPHSGARDIAAGIVRAVGTPERRFAEDFLRILRMLRFAARFDFQIDPATWHAALAAAPGLRGLSAERVREEWFKGLGSVEEPKRLVTLWRESGASAQWLPELVEGYPLGSPLPRPHDPVVLTAALCADPAGVLKRLKASNEEIGRARAMTVPSQAPPSAEPVVVRR
jgi:tRNA nucleotidyltransferase (CCA-adding enzyme)